ncbi:MAG: hypothetical protein HQ551_05915 [Desulfobacteraceae bacterium]|nr:hypothetical protein [Desulfobacteraceae bacterium]
MAWTDQCKIAFKTNAEGLIHNGKGVRETLRELAKDSGIPYGTVRDWYYPKKDSVPKVRNKKKPSQETAWKNVARRMESLTKYMAENCDPSACDPLAEVSVETRCTVLGHAENLRSWRDILYRGTERR